MVTERSEPRAHKHMGETTHMYGCYDEKQAGNLTEISA